MIPNSAWGGGPTQKRALPASRSLINIPAIIFVSDGVMALVVAGEYIPVQENELLDSDLFGDTCCWL